MKNFTGKYVKFAATDVTSMLNEDAEVYEQLLSLFINPR